MVINFIFSLYFGLTEKELLVDNENDTSTSDHSFNSYIFINALCWMSFIVSFIFNCVKKSKIEHHQMLELKNNELFDNL